MLTANRRLVYMEICYDGRPATNINITGIQCELETYFKI